MATHLKILAVDDDPFVLQTLSHQLAILGFNNVKTSGACAGALNTVENPETCPDVILLDLNMPGMDGVEFIRAIALREFKGRVVLVSGESERMLLAVEKIALTYNIGVIGHLGKPVSSSKLAAVLETMVSGANLGMSRSVVSKLYTAEALRIAIERGELVNYYQPKVEVATGAVVGVEALVRWKHPVDGLVYPDQFIALAENNGLISALTHTVLSQALQHTRAWADAGLPLHLAVNISMADLVELDFPDVLAQLAKDAGVSPRTITLEVTESCLVADLCSSLDILSRLSLKRFGLAIDDFGTGNSSMKQLHDIPFDELKVDRSFVHGATEDNAALAIYTASLRLARDLGMQVVAEGVENREDWDLLVGTGCDIAQGYFIAKPMPAAQLAGWVDDWNRCLRPAPAADARA